MEGTKGGLASKTVWAGLLSTILGLLAWFDVIPTGSQEVLKEAALVVIGQLVIIFRVFSTSTKIKGWLGSS